jgi:hypothetical protein
MAAANNNAPTHFDQIIASRNSLMMQLLTGLRLRIQEIGRLVVPGAFKAYGGWLEPVMIVYLPVFFAIGIGWFHMVSRRPSSLLLAFPLYFSLYVIWPFDQGGRFMTPMVPILWLSLAGFLLHSQWKSYISRFFIVLIILCSTTSLIYLIVDKVESKKFTSDWAVTEAISKALPQKAQIGLIRTSQSFATICSLKRDRVCIKISNDGEYKIPPEFHYLVLGSPPLLVPGFAPILRIDAYTVLKRIESTNNRRE